MIYNAAYAARFDDPVKKTVLQSGAMALLHFDKSLLLLVVLAAFGGAGCFWWCWLRSAC